jgi:ABC-type glycerol-3-phosphate transport system permease component
MLIAFFHGEDLISQHIDLVLYAAAATLVIIPVLIYILLYRRAAARLRRKEELSKFLQDSEGMK